MNARASKNVTVMLALDALNSRDVPPKSTRTRSPPTSLVRPSK